MFRSGVPPPKAQKQQADKKADVAAKRRSMRRDSDRSIGFALGALGDGVQAQALQRNPPPGGELFAGAAGGRGGADDSSSTATRTSKTSSNVSHQSSRELEERGKAMDFANSFLQFVKEQRL
jgi:hypothetical protein